MKTKILKSKSKAKQWVAVMYCTIVLYSFLKVNKKYTNNFVKDIEKLVNKYTK